MKAKLLVTLLFLSCLCSGQDIVERIPQNYGHNVRRLDVTIKSSRYPFSIQYTSIFNRKGNAIKYSITNGTTRKTISTYAKKGISQIRSFEGDSLIYREDYIYGKYGLSIRRFEYPGNNHQGAEWLFDYYDKCRIKKQTYKNKDDGEVSISYDLYAYNEGLSLTEMKSYTNDSLYYFERRYSTDTIIRIEVFSSENDFARPWYENITYLNAMGKRTRYESYHEGVLIFYENFIYNQDGSFIIRDYRNDKLEGEYTYSAKGAMIKSENFANGITKDFSYKHDRKGNIINIEEFENGELISTVAIQIKYRWF